MKVLFILEYFPPHVGGVEVLFQNLAEGLVKKGHEVSVITQRLKGTKPYEEKNGVAIHRVWVPSFLSRYWFSLLALPKAISLAKKADIIQTTTYNAALPAKITSVICKKKAVLAVMEVLGDTWEKTELGPVFGKLHKLLEKAILALKFDHFVAISEYTKRELIRSGISEGKITVVYPGLDYAFFDPKKYEGYRETIRKLHGLDKSFVYVSYGRPGITKGIEYLVRAVPKITEAIPSSKLVLILSRSPASGYKKIVSLIKELGVENNIVLVESQPRSELPKYITAADCAVVPSLTEGFGYSAAEAIALGVPLVASNSTSLPEVVCGKYVLVETANPQAIAEGVVKVYNKKYNTSAVKRFTTEENVEGHLKIYKDLLS
jgi:D-inositol-3-phosphate glycosyltransferase